MRLTARVAAPCGVALFALLAASAPAIAAPARITGELSKSGYSVIAVAANGQGKAARATPTFRLRPPSEKVTLHLRDPDGVYVGPIVMATADKGKRAILGVRAGTSLGDIAISARKGYGRVRDVPSSGRLEAKRFARAKNGIPLGAGNFGLVRSKPLSKPPPGDADVDGVANPLDIDSDGNRVLDRFEAPGTGLASVRAAADIEGIRAIVLAVNADGTVRARVCGDTFEATAPLPPGAPALAVGMSYLFDVDQASGGGLVVRDVYGPVMVGCPPALPDVTPALGLPLKETVNANAAPLSVADIDAALSRRGILWIRSGMPPETSIELDCGGVNQVPPREEGLAYCTKGGTGRASRTLIEGLGTFPRDFPLAFPDCCDSKPAPKGDGFGELDPFTRPAGDPESTCGPTPCVNSLLSHGATTEQIGTGDILNWRITEDGVEKQYPTALSDVFATVPALTSYDDDGPGGAPPRQISYPVPPPFVGSPAATGTQGPYQGLPISPCPAGAAPPCVPGEVVVTFEFWRPQREAIPTAGEAGQWTDIGGLVYSPGIHQQGGVPVPNCDPEHLFTDDQNLSMAPGRFTYGDGFGFRDKAKDAPASDANRLTFSANLTQCLGLGALEAGQLLDMWLVASPAKPGNSGSGANAATQRLLFVVE